MVSRDDDTKLKLVDFGFARKLGHPALAAGELIGTPQFVAPEVLERKPYDCKVDVWSCGCMIYIILSGYPPFYDLKQDALFEKIKEGRYSFHQQCWQHTSRDVRKFIRAMLTVDPAKRASARALLSHAWFTEKLESIDLTPCLRFLRAARARHQNLHFDDAGEIPDGPHSEPSEHADYDTQIEGRPIDTTGDGVADAIGYDTTGDGMIDALDTNLDGRIDTRCYDTTGDGQIDALDTNLDGKIDTRLYDTTGDGKIDSVDTTMDGKINVTLHDTTGDGRHDALDTTGDGRIDHALVDEGEAKPVQGGAVPQTHHKFDASFEQQDDPMPGCLLGCVGGPTGDADCSDVDALDPGAP